MKNDSAKKQYRNTIIIAVVLSFFVGGAAGALFGILGGSIVGGNFTANSSDNFFGLADSKTVVVEESSSTIDVVENVSPSVVSIIATQDLSELYNQTGPNIYPFDYYFGSPNSFTPPTGKQEVSSGTGFIISPDGMIITNKHVVSLENAEYSVLMNDGKRYDAVVVSVDPLNDIAILDIEADNLPTVELGDSDAAQIGQTVIAIGNSLGEYLNTVTRGVISGINRIITASGGGSSETLEGVIQTDASINPGNSGGPLLNLAGQVIGINTAIDREGESIGFAIPINEAKIVITSVQKYGKIIRPVLGIRYVPITSALAEQNELSADHGALIVKGNTEEDVAVLPNSPAEKAGLKENDVIIELGGYEIEQSNSLAKIIRKLQPGDTVMLKVLRDGKEIRLEAV
ncbi:trypsin-like peptidase domain-containing protein, partial [Patescibacteria group bacterium]|nr:trypsin-like peptidase domain-containing protein [Patescibacteria group bacterium]